MKIFITGSTTGLGLLAGQKLLERGHDVLFHARSKSSALKKNTQYVFGDLSSLEEVRGVADQVKSQGAMDVIIHNAGVYTASSKDLLAVNVLAPYLLNTLVDRPKRMIFMSSGLHLGGEMNLDSQTCTYSDTKLFDLMLAKWFARHWPETLSNAVDPGWVPTRMGGTNAPDDLDEGASTQVWLADSSEEGARVTGKYFHHRKPRASNPIADSIVEQDRLVKYLESCVGANRII